MDPTDDELAQINTVQDALDWAERMEIYNNDSLHPWAVFNLCGKCR